MLGSQGRSAERALGYRVLQLLLHKALLQKFAHRETPPSCHRSIAHVVDQRLMYARPFRRFLYDEIQNRAEALDLAHDQLSDLVVRLRRFGWWLTPSRALCGSVSQPVKVVVGLHLIPHAFLTKVAIAVPEIDRLWLAHMEYSAPF